MHHLHREAGAKLLQQHPVVLEAAKNQFVSWCLSLGLKLKQNRETAAVTVGLSNGSAAGHGTRQSLMAVDTGGSSK
jgi:hypothetical protein